MKKRTHFLNYVQLRYMSKQLKINDGINKYNSRGEKHGEWIEWWNSSQLWYQKFWKDGKLYNKSTHWYQNGMVMSIQNWKDGKKNGEQKFWWNNGQLMSQQYWKDGKADGDFKEWGKNGQLRCSLFWKDGKLHGARKDWDSNGQLVLHQHWFEGIRYPHDLLPKLQQKVRQKILYRKFRDLVTSRGFQEAWWDPNSFGGWWYKKRLLEDMDKL